MNRPPYPARVAAGLLVVTAAETRKLPTRVLTLPMTAISRGLQAGMRLQQNIAELAIKGDELLAPLYGKLEEQPAWARFDEDEHPVPSRRDVRAGSAASARSDLAAARNGAAKAAAAAKQPPPPAPRSTAKAAPATPARTGTAKTVSAPPEHAAPAADASAGRFALYSSPPADLKAAGTVAEAPAAPSGPVPEVVGMLDYDTLTLAQLRAKVRTVDIDELRELRDYETANRGRAPFVTMIENRIAAAEKKAGADKKTGD